MAKRIVWTNTAKKARREILEYWIKHNGSSVYSKKLSKLFRTKASLLETKHYLGKPTDVGIWDNRRNPDDLRKNLEL